MNTKIFAAAAAAAAFLPHTAHAQTTFTDNASSYNGYVTGDGAGVAGFTAFNIAATGAAGTFVYTAAESEQNNGTPAPSTIDTNGKSFGVYAQNAGSSTTITRGFSVPSQSSGLNAAGDAFSLNFVTGYNDGVDAAGNPGAGSAGVSLLTAGGTVGTFEYVSNDQYLFNNQLVTKPDGSKQDYSTGAFSLLYTLTSPTAYTLTVGGPFQFTGTGTLTSPVTGFEVQQVNAGVAPDASDAIRAAHNAYFNNLSVTAADAPSAAPEPSQTAALALVVLGTCGLLLRRRISASPA